MSLCGFCMANVDIRKSPGTSDIAFVEKTNILNIFSTLADCQMVQTALKAV